MKNGYRAEEHYCTKCGVELVDEENFRPSNRKCSKYKCSSCIAEGYRESILKSKYGITVEDYDKMYEFQGGCCDVCGRHQTEFQKRLAVDHDHETGAVRSLLCASCNSGIGKLGDDIATVREALNYLIRHSEEE
jgi:hypothetical protein